MAKLSSKQIIKSLKEKANKDLKANITFRLPLEIVDQFRDRCAKEKVSMASVIELMMREFIEN